MIHVSTFTVPAFCHNTTWKLSDAFCLIMYSYMPLLKNTAIVQVNMFVVELIGDKVAEIGVALP